MQPSPSPQIASTYATPLTSFPHTEPHAEHPADPRPDAERVDQFAAAIHARFALHPTHLTKLSPPVAAPGPSSPFFPARALPPAPSLPPPAMSSGTSSSFKLPPSVPLRAPSHTPAASSAAALKPTTSSALPSMGTFSISSLQPTSLTNERVRTRHGPAATAPPRPSISFAPSTAPRAMSRPSMSSPLAGTFSARTSASRFPPSPINTPRAAMSPLSPSSATATSPTTPSSSDFVALAPADLPAVLADPSTLVLDIRPHNAYATARLPSALSLSVPSTLLKRPTFQLARVAPMIHAPAARARFAAWREASRILVYDADAPGLAERPALLGLLRKFRTEGFDAARPVAWLRGGFNAAARECPALVDTSPLAEEEEEEEDAEREDALGEMAAPGGVEMSKSQSAPAPLRTRALPRVAFTGASTLAPARPFGAPTQVPATPAGPRADPFASVPPTPGPSLLAARGAGPAAGQFTLRLPGLVRGGASAPGASVSISLNANVTATAPATGVPGGLAGGPAAQTVAKGGAEGMHAFPALAASSMSVPTLSASPGAGGFGGVAAQKTYHHSVPHTRPVAVNPFFDAIRQNLELGRGEDIESGRSAGIALKLPRRVRRRVGDLPFEWLREIARRGGRAQESSSSTEDEDEDMDRGAGNKAREREEPEGMVEKELGKGKPPRAAHVQVKAREARSTTPPPSPPSSPTISHPPGHARPGAKAHANARLAARAPAPAQSRPQPIPGRKPLPLGASPPSSPGAEAGDDSSTSQSPPSADELTRALELQFYRIELGEQHRLMGIMEHHSMESHTGAQGAGVSVSSAGVVRAAEAEAAEARGKEGEKGKERQKEVFPFSITAGLEKGNKNRYRNIWPFEHARVRLRKARPEDDDYMNASYVQPLGTTKRYIATQGPLQATFADFWTLVWEQNVHVIVMLTREIEGATVKCGKYWDEGEYGQLHLKLLATDDTPEREKRRRESESGFFGVHAAPQQAKRKGGKSEHGEHDTVRRVFKLTHRAFPRAPPRIVTQLQYLDWPDFNVPSDPRGVLGLIREVEEAVARSKRMGDRAWGEGPLLPGPWPARVVLPERSPRTSPPPQAAVEGAQELDGGMEPTLGVARHALGNPPVLLHCSAGVGRTGGFIAVDAVLDGLRREMRKRKKTQAANTAPGSTSAGVSGSAGTGGSGSGSGSGSRSRSSPRTRSPHSGGSSRGEPMEVDSSPSPPSMVQDEPPLPDLTVPVSVGQSEVHVRVAGFTESVPMDVDGTKEPQGPPRSPPAGARTKPKDLPRTVLPASPELVDEVRRATLFRWPSHSTSTTMGDAVLESKDSETSSSDSYPTRSGAGSASHSGTGVRSHSHTSTSPPTSQAGSSTSLSAAMTSKAAQMSLKAGPPKVASPERPTPMDVDQEAPKFTLSPPGTSPSKLDATEPSRLDTWRSEVRTSGEPPREDVRSPSKSPAAADAPGEHDQGGGSLDQRVNMQRGRTFDYAQPRRLHEDLSPPLLSTYDEPIRRVVEDMREQRMSLCQSLRQYVFVHRAVIEGALMVVDEERERERLCREATDDVGSDEAQTGTAMDVSTPARNVEGPMMEARTTGLGAPGAAGDKELSRKRSLSDVMREGALGEEHAQAQASPGRPKRGASPTELQKESKRGEVMLTKRPSVKRAPRTDSDSSASAEFAPMGAHETR
ncbi:hypothetical protein WOLCODRAFT_147143 [Wolfiporia cocos MD-104 SS10]|uniref:protein-tyrosine-phosphatase n=1 Tax=Wolfiporia cocos (strain MD-104) TaxID=742152 RepID=A0A2H3J5W7_WOLCO|nr:hypothetical protein WOLCODRAFT_147143 [Wolfiporia cocos MD-104 SS10]